MAEDLGLMLYEGQVRAARDTLESYLLRHHEAMKATAVEALLPQIIELADFPGRALALVSQRLEDDEENPQTAGPRLLSIFDTTIRVLEGAAELVREQQQRGFEIQGAGQLRDAVQKLQSLREQVARGWPADDRPWPAFSPALTVASRAALARGEALTYEEFARELGRPAD